MKMKEQDIVEIDRFLLEASALTLRGMSAASCLRRTLE